jgi:monovalent cation:H+ antiporter-2, CPA2 family
VEHGVSANDYKDFILFLATAGVVVPLFKRLRISPILGFLGAGIALGPFGLGALSDTFPWLDYFTVANPQDIRILAELGVVFLLFMIGLELSWDRLRLLRRMVFGLGGLQVLASLAIIAGVVFVTGAGPGAALAAGAALALSSTAIVVPILGEQKRMHSATGRAAFSVLLFQDLAVAPILITLALLGGAAAAGGAGAGRTDVVVTVLQAVAGLAAVIVVGRLLLRPMFKSVARAKSEELFMATCLLVVIGAGSLTALAGLSMALGAFIAGLLLAETEYRHEVEVTIEPFKGLFLGLFFVSMGIGLNLRVLADQPLLVLALALTFVSLKAITITLLSRLFGLKLMDALETGLLLGAGGEFAFVIMNQAMGSGIVGDTLGEAVMMSAGISMFLIPALALAARRLRAMDRKSPEPETAPDPPAAMEDPSEQRVLVVGYGRVGVLVGDLLDRHGLPWVAIDRDPRLVEQGRRRNHRVYFGEASRVDFLNRCGLENAKAVVVTMDSPEAVEAVVASARQARPELIIVARARDARHAKILYELGATEAVPETIEASLQLSESLLVDIGVPMGLVIASIHEKRDEIRAELNRPDALGARTRKARDRLTGASR